MRKYLFFLALLLATASAGATNIVFDTLGNIVGSYTGPRSVAADWVASGGVSGGARMTSAGTSLVPTLAGDLALPGVMTAELTAARIAGLGLKTLPVVGAALTAYEIFQLFKEAAPNTACKDGSGICVPSPTDTLPPTVTGGWRSNNGTGDQTFSSGQQVCNALAATRGSTLGFVDVGPNANNGWTDYGFCHVAGAPAADTSGDLVVYTMNTSSCPGGYALMNNVCLSGNPTPVHNDAQAMANVQAKMGQDSTYAPRLMTAYQDDNRSHPGIIPIASVLDAATTTGSTFNSVSGPQVTTSTATVPNSDGSTSTVTTKQQSSVEPTGTGSSTTSGTDIKFNPTTTTTVTTTNNVTNVTNTTVTITNNPPVHDNPPGQPPPASAPDTSPKECGTPGKPKCQIDENGTPDSSAAKNIIDPQTKVITDSITTATTAITTNEASMKDTAWKFSFALPTGCSSYPLFLGVVADFCKFQPMVHDLMSFLWYGSTVFLIIGMFGRAARES